MSASPGTIAGVPGISVGCWTDRVGRTGCTVVLCPPEGAVVGVDVRGGAPGTRETELAHPGMLVQRAHAVLLAGGSAYGLDAASGVMRWLEERGRGFLTRAGPVPIVPAAVVFDLATGNARARPDAAAGYAACEAASPAVPEGSVGAGTGCTVGKSLGPGGAQPGGQGGAAFALHLGGATVTVGALVAVNAVGDVYDPETGQIVAGARRPDGRFAGLAPWRRLEPPPPRPEPPPGLNTTVGVVATDAPLESAQAERVAGMAHDGLARAVRPAHTLADGDTLFALATGGAPGLSVPLPPLVVSAIGAAAADAVALAVLRAVRAAALQKDGPSRQERGATA